MASEFLIAAYQGMRVTAQFIEFFPLQTRDPEVRPNLYGFISCSVWVQKLVHICRNTVNRRYETEVLMTAKI